MSPASRVIPLDNSAISHCPCLVCRSLEERSLNTEYPNTYSSALPFYVPIHLQHRSSVLLFADHHLPLDYNNTPIAALSVSMPTFRISGEKEKEVVQILWEAKHRIEAHFQVYGVNFGN